ncbi:DUF2306 domain-containing protein [Thioalkalivibrio sp. HK1]|uniref:DUF2306 domain-containing protein n=1 Tax=Thioalkalivibrio sp. HK1 TaxID=1469245 RepID=UPI0018CC7579|nr:DUF2306 domain-containing protein [Thioalkalivibrio sp. HK1]
MNDIIWIWLHLSFALAALALGAINLAGAKGTLRHVIIGWTWVGLMSAVALGSFQIRELEDGRLSWIHLLSVFTLLSMALAIHAIRFRRDVNRHRRAMIGTMIGAITAGVFALLPGRYLPGLLGF